MILDFFGQYLCFQILFGYSYSNIIVYPLASISTNLLMNGSIWFVSYLNWSNKKNSLRGKQVKRVGSCSKSIDHTYKLLNDNSDHECNDIVFEIILDVGVLKKWPVPTWTCFSGSHLFLCRVPCIDWNFPRLRGNYSKCRRFAEFIEEIRLASCSIYVPKSRICFRW